MTRRSWIRRYAYLRRIMRGQWLSILERYILGQFLTVLFICLFAATSLFLVFETFERMKTFISQKSSILQALSYLGLKIPLIIHLMTPVAVLIAVLFSVGRLSQLSEVTAMRACGASVFAIMRPLVYAAMVISVLMFVAGETVVPWATQRVEEIFQFDIKKKHERGNFSRSNFWYRDQSTFYSFGYYDSKESSLEAISILEFDSLFRLTRRTDARGAQWDPRPEIGWLMDNAVEMTPAKDGSFDISSFTQLPLVIKEKPKDFYAMKRESETLSAQELKNYIDKLRGEGVPVTKYEVDLAAKISFPLVNVVVVLIAFPFALIPARSGSLSRSFVAGVTIGFGYYIVHALSTSLASAELLPILPGAWAANILFGSIGGFLLAGAER